MERNPSRRAGLALLVVIGAVFAGLSVERVTSSAGTAFSGMRITEGLPERNLDADEWARVRAMRQEGLANDHSHVQEMIASLSVKRHPFEVGTAIMALSRLGATEALGPLQALENGTRYEDQARIAHARIVAEDANSTQPPGAAYASAVVNRFLSELGVSIDGINTVVGQNPLSRNELPVELLALRSIADMLYHDPSGAFAGLPQVKAINFAADYSSMIKFRLAPLSPAARLQSLVDELAQSRVDSQNQCYEIVLAAEYGAQAGDAVDAKLQQMVQHRDLYHDGGYEALFDVIRTCGDPTHGDIGVRFEKDPDPVLRNDVRGGVPIVIPDY